MKVLIFDPIGGASGDMILGSLIHLGCPIEYLQGILDGLDLGGYNIKTSLKKVNGIESLDLKFDVERTDEVRRYSQIKEIISQSTIPQGIKQKALRIFDLIALAESDVHGIDPDDVHFHEVGAVDSILDIVGISAALEWLDVDEAYTRPVPVGYGTTDSMHGIIPVPAPATVKLLAGIKIRVTGIEAELVTPTGAAVLKAISEVKDPPSDMVITGVGYGCGDRQYQGWPNLFRSILCEVPDEGKDQVYVTEADVDDMSPEEWEAVTQRLFEVGALDVSLTSRIMKRGRPGVGIKAISSSKDLQDILTILLTHSTSIGARYYLVERRVLPRKEYTIHTRYGDVKVKEVIAPDGVKRYKPEYRDMYRISVEEDISVAQVRADLDKVIRGRIKD
ncbi:MAG: nickel pincer cofactor biosynthesis protein LarC [Thermodesulfobacteriota bacterium]|nr:nickel pincer cofactor biosynthesis protein LarC [Thermodesulfobacteriota bacterium]